MRNKQDNIVPALQGRPGEEKPLRVLSTKKLPEVFLLEVTLNPLQKEANSKKTCEVHIQEVKLLCIFSGTLENLLRPQILSLLYPEYKSAPHHTHPVTAADVQPADMIRPVSASDMLTATWTANRASAKQ